MNKIYKEKYDETYYEETLDNGLKVIIFHKPLYESTIACFGVPYGSLNIKQKQGNKEYNFHPGVAHFLEHKLFETEGKDIMNKFASYGAQVNAFTSYTETIYYFSTSSLKIKKELNLLLDFVQKLEISKASVEKEKSIICEELQMYLKKPESRLINETFKSLYKNYPLNIDIGGTCQTVKETNVEELYECYNLNYHPCNMQLVIVTPCDPNEVIEIIRNNQNKKNFKYIEKPITEFSEEPKEVNRKEYSLKMDVGKTKTCYAIKLNNKYKDNLEALKDKFCLFFYFESYFSELNEDYQNWLDEELINDFFSYEISINKDVGFIIFSNENDDKNVLKELIDNELKENLFNEDILNQIKHRFIGVSLKEFNSLEETCIEFIRNSLIDVNYFDLLETILNITYDDVIKAVNKIDFNNYALIHIESDKK